MKDIYVMGAGGLGKEMAWHLDMIGIQTHGLHLRGFLDDDETKWSSNIYSYPVLGKLEEIIKPGAYVLLGIGNPKHRFTATKRIQANSGIPYTLVGPNVVKAENAVLGEGAVIEIGAILGPDSIIGKGVLINKRAMVTHDAEVGDFCVLSPNTFLSGESKLGPGCFVGTHATINPGVSVGRGCVIGAGAVVTQNLPPFSLAVGVPAVIKQHVPEWEI